MDRHHVRRVLQSIVLLLAIAVTVSSAGASGRVALVVGNSSYLNVPSLPNPANDAKLMAETLRGLGFELVGGSAQLNLDKRAFDLAVQSFGRRLQGAEVALFYYAGHGVQVRGNNYLVPVNANPTRAADIDFQMLDVNLVLRQMEGSGTRLNLVILDACRNNPFGGRGLRSVAGGLAEIQAPEGTLISFATQPGNVAADGTGGHSPFTKALATTLREPGLGLFDAFNSVGLAVKRATGGAQQPWLSSSPIAGNFYFAGRAAGTAAPGPAGDEIAWDFLKQSKDPEELRRFIRQFPSSKLKADAERRIASLSPPQSASSKDQNATAPATYAVRFETSKGPFVIQVHRAWAPRGADRFYNLVNQGFYNNVRFFRVISGFMAQFGINGDPRISTHWREASIPDDPVKHSNRRGSITFASGGKNTRTTQVFINFRNNTMLDRQGFAPFGEVASGMKVVDSLNAEYSEGAPRGHGPDQSRIQTEGNAYLMKAFPHMDYVKKATIVK